MKSFNFGFGVITIDTKFVLNTIGLFLVTYVLIMIGVVLGASDIHHHNTDNEASTVVNLSQDFSSKDWGGDIVEIYGISWPQEFHVKH